MYLQSYNVAQQVSLHRPKLEETTDDAPIEGKHDELLARNLQ